MNFDAELDTLGLQCPLPVLKARKRLGEMPAGAVLCLVSDDPLSAIDVPFFCSEAGHELLSSVTEGSAISFLIRKRP
ncbi:putative redox protein, regulator of disulfide bond formation [Hoeflea sp. IMCC20628]|uniref:sulfurtransferase TusA family protein n=1 Tax=Hoeflea sp. IMCC20628 TaxID=1620421 RepID=UPI00063B0015|nr:sulfurtransferase TusA family protein [Hoeflea sp. IMCC20628]AKI01981.1 putative redox protein, regulator of disulfide bond formation [Hoeflea sp. IMCC20628]